MSNLTSKQISFCENYILTRDIKQSSLNAGYSESYSKSKAYELLQDKKIQQQIQKLEIEHNQEHFKKLSILANKELETILLSSDNDNTRLRAIELVYKLSGVIQDDKVSLTVNNANVNQNIKTLDDFYDLETMSEKEINNAYLDMIKGNKKQTKKIVKETLSEFDKNY